MELYFTQFKVSRYSFFRAILKRSLLLIGLIWKMHQ